MRQLFKKLFGWLVRYFLSFVLIVAVLVGGKLAWREYGDFRRAEAELAGLTGVQVEVEEHFRRMRADVTERVAGLEKAPLNVLNARIEAIDGELRQTSAEQLPFFGKLPFAPGFAERLKRDVAIRLLGHEREYLAGLRSTLEILQKGPAQLEVLRQGYVAGRERLTQNEIARARVTLEHPIASMIYGLPAHRELKALEQAGLELLERNQRAYEDYDRQRRLIELKKAAKHRFAVSENQIAEALRPLQDEIKGRQERKTGSWLAKTHDLAAEAVPAALLILIAIILAPLAVKTIFYFVLAPLASRRPPICLLPGASGAIVEAPVSSASGPDPAMVSAVSMTLEIGHRDELLVKPEYLQSSSASGAKDTRWLLDWAHPVTSLASGMYGLTRVRTQARESIVISATGDDQWTEVGVLTLPQGSSLMLHPSHLIGIAYRSDAPLRVTSHWRLASLQAWLTLQLRFLVFHGPARLVVRGSRGIRVERAGGRRIRQAATIGFSANVRYSVMRCEPFAPYLFGRQQLLDDSFAGESGFFVYEESTGSANESGKVRRGLEGFADSLLKIFGI